MCVSKSRNHVYVCVCMCVYVCVSEGVGVPTGIRNRVYMSAIFFCVFFPAYMLTSVYYPRRHGHKRREEQT